MRLPWNSTALRPDPIAILLNSPMAKAVLADHIAVSLIDRRAHVAAIAEIEAHHVMERDRIDGELVKATADFEVALAALKEAEGQVSAAKVRRQICHISPQALADEHRSALVETAPPVIAEFITRCREAWLNLPSKAAVTSAPQDTACRRNKMTRTWNTDEITLCREALRNAIGQAEAMKLAADPGDGDVVAAIANLAEGIPALAWR